MNPVNLVILVILVILVNLANLVNLAILANLVNLANLINLANLASCAICFQLADKGLNQTYKGPVKPLFEIPALPFEIPTRRYTRYHARRHWRSLGTKSRIQIFKFRGFIDPSDQNEQYHAPLLSKI